MDLDSKVVAEFLAAVLQGSEQIDRTIFLYIDPEFFLDEAQGGVAAYRWLAKILHDRDWDPFPIDYLDQELLGVKDVEARKKYCIQIQALYRKNLSFVVDADKKFKDFVAYCIMNSTLKNSLEGYSRTNRIDYLLKDVKEAAGKAENVLCGSSGLRVVDYVGTYKDRQRMRLERKINPLLNPRILTGITGLDIQFQIKSPMVVNFLAPMKRYKSIVLNDIGFAALLQGFNVFHATFENKEELTSSRYDALFALLDHDRVANGLLMYEEKEKMDEMFAWMDSWDSRLEIAEAKRGKTTVEDIGRSLERLQYEKGFHPHVVVVDYFNLVKPVKSYKEDHFEQEEIIWDLKELAEEYDCAIIGATQSNRGGLTAERLQLDHQGKSIGILQAVDLAIAIDQTTKEKEEDIAIFSPLASRAGHIRIPEIILDTDLARMMISKDLVKMWDHAVKMHPYIPAGG